MALGAIPIGQQGQFVGQEIFTALGIGVPVRLHSYQNIDASVVLYWTFSPFSISFYSLKWEVQTDLVDTFNSPSLLSYSSDALPASASYIPGIISRGMSVPIYTRIEGQDLRMYWRVRGKYDTTFGSWTMGYYDIPQSAREEVRTSLLSFLPDILYDKTAGTVPGVGSNIYKIHDNYAKEFENSNRQLFAINKDLYIDSARDQALQPNFGDLYGFQKANEMLTIDYREVLRAFMTNIRSAPTSAAVRSIVANIYNNDPIFKNIRDVYATYIYDTGLPNAYVQDIGIESKYIWDNEHLATGVIIEVLNQLAGGTLITPRYLQEIVQNIVVTHTPVYVKAV